MSASLPVETLADETGTTAGNIDELADQVRVHARDEVVEVEVDVFDRGPEFRRVVVAQDFGIQVVEIGPCLDERPARLRHFLSVDGQEAMGIDAGRSPKARAFEHRRPEQRVEVHDVLADEVVQLGSLSAFQ